MSLQAGSASLSVLFSGAKVTLLEAPVSVDATIVSFDPGRTTGLAIATPDKTTKGTGLLRPRWIAAEVADLATVWRVLHAYRPATILFERFHAENPAANDEALDVRGIVKLYRALIVKPRKPPQVWWQGREAKVFSSDRMLKANDLWIPGKGHDRDALRHLVWHLVHRENKMELMEWSKPDGTVS